MGSHWWAQAALSAHGKGIERRTLTLRRVADIERRSDARRGGLRLLGRRLQCASALYHALSLILAGMAITEGHDLVHLVDGSYRNAIGCPRASGACCTKKWREREGWHGLNRVKTWGFYPLMTDA